MDMGGMNSTDSTGGMDMSNMPVMKMYFHFTGGDYVLFEKWQPMSHAGIAGASIALFAIAVFERLLSGVRKRLEHNWNRREISEYVDDDSSSGKKSAQLKDTEGLHSRTFIPRFNLAHDVPRLLISIVQIGISYALMLAVMTFNAAYCISIVLGLAIGDVFIGGGGQSMGH